MKKKTNLLVFIFCTFLLLGNISFAAEEENGAKAEAKPQGPPPALVEVVPVQFCPKNILLKKCHNLVNFSQVPHIQ